jgi:cellulose synthase/poly-beta-1,6-N-acetylglucosamine synthase-like glycosyltransferase
LPAATRLNSDAFVAAGTMAFTREIWRRCGGFPDQSIGEDSELLFRTVRSGIARGVVNHGIWAYVRHGANSWRFDFNDTQGPAGWVTVPSPRFMPAEDLAFYRALAS